MSFSLYKIILLLTVSVFYTVSSCREVLHADNVNNIQIGKDDVFTKPEQMKNTIVVDGNGRVKTGGIPEDISKIIDTANDAVKKYGNKEGKAVIIINENEVSQQQKSGENDEKKDSNDDSKTTKQKRRIVVDKVISVEKSGRIQPFTVVDESGEYLIEFKKPANVECNNACNNPFDKIVVGFQKGNNESSKKSSVKQSNSSNKTSKTVVKNKQTVKKSVNNGKKVANTKQNSFVKKLNRADKIVYTNNSDYQYNTNRKTKQDDFDDRMDGIEQIHCIGGCRKKQKSQQQKKQTQPNQQQVSFINSVNGNSMNAKDVKDDQNIYIINNIVGINEDMVITEDMIKKIEKNTKSKNKNIKQNTLFIKNGGTKSSKNDTIKIANAEQRDKYLASLIENVSIADDIKFGEVAFVDSYDGI